ncbi:LysM peptidoglycan-binding domain-containing protein [Paenibacillus puldeungensis]|uniref:LysM peptidoglycan-binding domain-containing protein n=1 Tax=Paenibacillus puldeungensis TaxID=696536 RepID=A0ABW3S1P3_9BACL
MADQSYGLRFDIYERVHLAEDVIGIEELEEIELFPKIQVIPGEEYASLRGHLLLSGLYRGEGETRELAHWIPVEITVPLSRVNRLEDITVEIENFDVDLLSARSLNITGVLSLQGIETTSLMADSDGWKDREFSTAHVVTENRAEEEKADYSFFEEDVQSEPQESALTTWQSFPLETQQQERIPDEQEGAAFSQEEISGLPENDPWADKQYTTYPAVEAKAEPPSAAELEHNIWFQEVKRPFANSEPAEQKVEDVAEEIQKLHEDLDLQAQVQQDQFALDRFEETQPKPEESPILVQSENEGVQAAPNEAVEAEHEAAKEEAAENQPNVQPEEKKELKIALGSKKNVSDEKGDGFGLKKLISPRTESELPIDAEGSPAAVETIKDHGDGEELRWKSLFIGSGTEQTPFRKVRMVIVQKEETLDDIAQRYHLSSRELQLYNRLSEHHLDEGQVLYIP